MRPPPPPREATLRQVAGEALSLAGGGRALLLQIAHPAVGRGVVEHSDFATKMMDRYHATMTFVYASVFASPEEFATVRRQVNRAHAQVRASASSGRPAYNAFDPALQLWVSSTLYATMIELNERVFGRLSDPSREAVYQQFTRLGLNLQLRPEDWPEDTVAFQRYWDEMVARLEVSDDARGVAGQLLHPRGVPLWLQAALPDIRLVTAGLLPPVVRSQFGLPWNESLARRFDRRLGWAATVYPPLPESLRHATRDAHLRRLRRSMITR